MRLALRPPPLAGREELLAELDSRLASGGASGPRTVVLSGLGGAGKTSVAVEYAYRHLAEVGLAWQFACEDAAVLTAGFADLAAQLGALDLADARDPVDSVHGVLAAYPREWLLVFDNAADRGSIASFLPPAGRGRVLITSRDQIWPIGHALDVPVLDPEVAAEFLVNRTGDPDRQAALDLAGELGGLPLALEQAAAYIQATASSLAGYLGSFRQRREELLARGEPTGYDETVATTWSLALRDLAESAPGAVGLLRLLAWYAPEAIPLSLLLQPRPGLPDEFGTEVAPLLVPLLDDPLAAGDAVAALRRYSLITPARDGSVSVHRLVQAVTIGQLPKELRDAWRAAATAVIEAALPDDPRQPDTWPVLNALLPQVQAAVTADSDSVAAVSMYLLYSGSYVTGREFCRGALEARLEALGAEHPDTLYVQSNLATFMGLTGDAVGARDQLAALLPVMERVSGAEDPDTVTVRNYLARWTGEAGDAAAARDQYAALLPIMQRMFGAEESITLATALNLALWTGQAGDAAAARDQLAALLPVMARVSGPEDALTQSVAASLALWTGQAGDAAAARDQLAALLPLRERVSGAEHPETLTTRNVLALWTGAAGDAAGARDQLAALLPDVERVEGPGHPTTLNVRSNLALWTGNAGDAAGARDQYAALLPVRERVSGPEHPDTLATRGNLAAWTGNAGDAAGARDQFAALLPVRERVSGPEHPHTLIDRNNLAYWTVEADDRAGSG